MRSNFKPVHLKEANVKLDKHVLSLPPYRKDKEVKEKRSLWKKFLGLFE